MSKRKLRLLITIGVILFIITTFVSVYFLGYAGLKLAGALFNALLNLAVIGFVVYHLDAMNKHRTYGKHVPYVMSVLTFWQLDYNRNPIMENGYRLQVDPKIVLLKLVCDPEYGKSLNLPDIGNHELQRYYTSMYIRMVDCVGLPPNLTYQEFTKHVARYLLGLTANPVKPQSGLGATKAIGSIHCGLNRR